MKAKKYSHTLWKIYIDTEVRMHSIQESQQLSYQDKKGEANDGTKET